MATFVIRENLPELVLRVVLSREGKEDSKALNKKGEKLRMSLCRIFGKLPFSVEVWDAVSAMRDEPPLDCYLFGVRCPLDKKEEIWSIMRKTAEKQGLKIED